MCVLRGSPVHTGTTFLNFFPAYFGKSFCLFRGDFTLISPVFLRFVCSRTHNPHATIEGYTAMLVRLGRGSLASSAEVLLFVYPPQRGLHPLPAFKKNFSFLIDLLLTMPRIVFWWVWDGPLFPLKNRPVFPPPSFRAKNSWGTSLLTFSQKVLTVFPQGRVKNPAGV